MKEHLNPARIGTLTDSLAAIEVVGVEEAIIEGGKDRIELITPFLESVIFHISINPSNTLKM